MNPVITWTGTATATSSIVHAGETRGTTTLLRREKIRTPNGDLQPIPIISGNTFRGTLRRHAEELLRETLTYEGELTLAAAHALRSGGALAKVSGEPLSGQRLAMVRALIPPIGIFGAAAGGTPIDGCLAVGKLVPHVAETSHLTGIPSNLSAFEATQLEAYSRHPDQDSPEPATSIAPAHQMRFQIETFPAGTTFSTWLQLRRPTPLEEAFFSDVLAAFTAHGHIGGRSAAGHGQLTLNLTQTPAPTTPPVDWRTHLLERRDDVMAALKELT